MSNLAPFSLKNRNPDVLTCIANLSNDEVFTPPELASKMLDLLAVAWADAHGGANIWENSEVTFLDPFTKSGVFLREVVERLTEGLAVEIPDLEERVNHILKKQVFGIAITQLTSLLARRSVYCSKYANGEHSVGRSVFDDQAGNIWFQSLEHEWVGGRQLRVSSSESKPIRTKAIGGKCKFCGASQSTLDRGDDLESHAYALIHNENVKAFINNIFGGMMQFDVVIGNPPYQLNTDGYGTQATPIYHKFVEQAKALDPKFLSMVIPARWFSGGMGLDSFRASMLGDNRLRVIEDYPDSNDVFNGTQIKGGVCYFLWDRDNSGLCSVTTNDKGNASEPVTRPLLEQGVDVFIRYNEAVPILKKVMAVENSDGGATLSLPEGKQFANLVSSIGAFGLDTKFRGKDVRSKGDLAVYRNGGTGYISRREITRGVEMIDEWKIFIPSAASGSDAFPHPILGKPFVGEPGTISSWTYNYIGPFKSELEAKNALTYISSRLFRLLVLLHKPSQHSSRSVYTFVPMQDFSKVWNDSVLGKKYGITEKEWFFIGSLIRPMELTGE